MSASALCRLMLLGSFFCAAPLPAFGAPRRLGLSAPLSGGGSGWGNDVKNVLTFANEKLTGGRYSFVFEDDRCDPRTSLTAARKLSSVDHIKEVFIVCGQATLAAAPAYRDSGVTVMAPLATPSRISELGVFRTALSDAAAAEKLARCIRARHSSVSVLTEDNDYSVSFLRDFVRSSGEIKLTVSNENYLPGQYDFRLPLLRLKTKGAAALFLNVQTEEALAALVRQLREIDYAPALYGAYLPGSAGFLQLAGAMAEGLVFVDFPGASELLTHEGKRLYEEYLARFGPLQGWSFAFPAAFEAFRAIHLAIESGEPTGQYLHHASFDGVFGAYRFDGRGDIVGPKHVVRVIRRGRAEPLTGGLERKPGGAMTITVTSEGFEAGGQLPAKFSREGGDLSPPLSWSGLPENTKELALIMDDPDAPTAEPWVHWVVYKIPARLKGLPPGIPAKGTIKDSPMLQGKNAWGTLGYGGPLPPRGHGAHHYYFKLYALDQELELPPGLTKNALLKAVQGHVMAEGSLIGTYER